MLIVVQLAAVAHALTAIDRLLHKSKVINTVRCEPTHTFLNRINCRGKNSSGPAKTIWELTRRCNLRCDHCYLPRRDLISRAKELPISVIKKIIRGLQTISCLELTFTGGEIFIRPDILKILAYARQKGFLIKIITNATLINKNNIRNLVDLGAGFSCDITLNSLKENTNRVLTGVSGSLSKTLKAVELLKTHKVFFNLNTLVTRANFTELPKIQEFAIKLNTQHNWDFFLHPCQNNPKKKQKQQISLNQITQLIQREFAVTNGNFCRRDTTSHQLASGKALYCQAGTTLMYLNPAGRAGLCIDFPLPYADTVNLGPAVAWQKVQQFAQTLKAPADFKCCSCDLVNECSWCPALGWIYHKNPFCCVAFYKNVAYATQKVIFGKQKS